MEREQGGRKYVFLLSGKNTLDGTDDRLLYARTSLWKTWHKKACFEKKKKKKGF